MPLLPRTIPAYESMLIGGNQLPSSLVLALKQDRNDLYDLRDNLLNLFVDDETPNGPQNSTNKTFTLASAPQPPQSLELYRNGSLLIFGVDYNLIGNSIALAVAPTSTDILVAFYRTRRGLPAPSSIAVPPPVPTGGGGGFTSGLWTQVGSFLYPTAFATTIVSIGATSTIGFFGPGSLISNNIVGVYSAPTNAVGIHIGFGGSTETFLKSMAFGVPATLPLSFYVGGVRCGTFLTTGDLLVGFFTSDASGGTGRILANTLVGVLSATANSPYIFMQANSGGVENTLQSTRTGTGAQLPLSFYVAPTGRVATFTTGGQFFFLRFASSGVGATMQLTGNFEASGLNNAFGFNGTTANATATAILAFQGIQIQSTGAANLSFLGFQCDTTNNLSQITSSHLGTGSNLPLTFNIGASEAMRITTGGTFLIGITSTDATVTDPSVFLGGSGSYNLVTAATNASIWFVSINPGTRINIASSKSGTGTVLPITVFIGSLASTFDTVGSFICGATSTDISGAGRIVSVGGSSLVGCASAATNSSFFIMQVFAGSDARLTSNAFVTLLPMTFFIGGTEMMRLNAAATRIFMNRTTDDGTGAFLQVVGGISVGGVLLNVP